MVMSFVAVVPSNGRVNATAAGPRTVASIVNSIGFQSAV